MVIRHQCSILILLLTRVFNAFNNIRCTLGVIVLTKYYRIFSASKASVFLCYQLTQICAFTLNCVNIYLHLKEN